MIVTLTHHQARSVAHRVSKLHHRTMLEHRTKRGRTQHDYDLPAIAWRQILDEMQRVCFGPMGGRLDRGVPKSAYTAIRRIADAVRRIENHPALAERAVEGWVGDLIPAWANREFRMSPYPPGNEELAAFTVYVPRHLTLNEMQITTWTAFPYQRCGVDSWTLEASTHLRFVDAVAAGSESELLPDEFEFEDLVSRQAFGSAKRGRIEDV